MAQTKGVGFTNVQSFVRERHGDAAWREVTSGLTTEDQEVLRGVIAMGWYDLDLFARLLGAVDRVCGGGDGSVIDALGRFEAERDITRFQQWILRLFHPSFAIAQMGRYWGKFHDSGSWTVVKNGERELIATLEGWGIVDERSCREVNAYLGRTLELISRNAVRIEHPRCRCRGDALCEFRADWRVTAPEAG